MRGILETAAMMSFNGAKHARTRFVRWTAHAKRDAGTRRARSASTAKRLGSPPCSTTFAPTFSPVALLS